MSLDHADYRNPAATCPRVRLSDLRVGDVVWVRAPDSFDPWYVPRRIDAVIPSTGGSAYVMVSAAGNDGGFYSLRHDKWGERYYLPASEPVYLVVPKD